MNTSPYLLFTDHDLAQLRERRKADPVGRQLFYDLMASAEWARKQPILAEPPAGPSERTHKGPVPLGQSPYRQDYLLVHEAFETVTAAFERAVIESAFIYRLTGNQPFADRAIQWLGTAMHEWKSWAPQSQPLDQFAVRVMYGTVLGCDWLGDAVPAELLATCRARAVDYADRCVAEWGKGLDGTDPHQVGNHHWFDTAMLGMTALWLERQDDAGKWKQVTARCAWQLGKLCEWTIGPDGDYLDKPGFLLYALRWTLPTMVALQRAGYGDLLSKPTLGAAASWLTDMTDPGDMNLMYYPTGLLDRWVLLLLAARHRLPRAQWAALQMTDAPIAIALPTYEEWFRSGPLWSYLFYDETLTPEPPAEPSSPPPRHYRSAGFVCMGSYLSPERPKVMLYAGPAAGKNFHDQGNLLVSAFGQRLLEIPQGPIYGYLSAHRVIPYMMSNLSGNVLEVDGLGQASGKYPREWPPGKSVGHEIEPPLAQITRVDSGRGWSRVRADLSRAYQDFNTEGMWGCEIASPREWQGKIKDRLERYIRHVMLAGERWIIVQDDIEPRGGAAGLQSGGKSLDLEWHFGTHAEIELHAPDRATIQQGRAAMDVYLFSPAEAQISAKPAPATETGKFLAIRHAAVGATRLILALHIRRSGEVPDPPSFSNSTLTAGGRAIRLTDEGPEIAGS